jgi:hypothetical protein
MKAKVCKQNWNCGPSEDRLESDMRHPLLLELRRKWAGKVSLVAIDAKASPMRADDKMVAHVSAQKADEASLAVADAGLPPGRVDEEMAAAMAAQKAGEVSLESVDTGEYSMKTVAAQEASEESLAAAAARVPPRRLERS